MLLPDLHLTSGVPVFAALVLIHVLSWGVVLRAGGDELRQAPHIAAHSGATLFGFGALAILGVHGWLHDAADQSDVTGYVASGERLGWLMLGFQAYELGLCAFAAASDKRTCKALCGPGNVMVGHHLIVLLLATLCVTGQYLHAYGLFFFGVPEVSSVPLVLVDFFKAFPLARSRHAALNEASRVAFAAGFLAIRCVWWPIVSYCFWCDIIADQREEARTPFHLPLIFAVCNVLMTGLQFFWGSKIVAALVKMAAGDPPHKEA
jgi:hypothetical protein